MRNIGTLQSENNAQRLVSYLKRKGIHNTCEIAFEPASGHMSYQIWVHEEDRLEEAKKVFETFIQSPLHPEYDLPRVEEVPKEEPSSSDVESEPEEETPSRRRGAFFTHLILALCTLVFFLNGFQEIPLLEEGAAEEGFSMTPIQAELLYDLPPFFEHLYQIIQKHKIAPNQQIEKLSSEAKMDLAAIPHTPYWRGIYDWLLLKIKTGQPEEAEGPLFIKLRQGEFWRLFSPCFLHANFLHILFNMLWVWILSRPIEERLGFFKLFLLSSIVAVSSNTLQYLVGGPFFIGYSGVVMGLAGFIWSREKLAPWEGYPVQKSTFLFLTFFILAMFGLQFSSFILQLFTSIQFSPNIANTAHIGGALVGALLGRTSFFAWRISK